ncbi:efflux RND transporter periplasmic adaptor subunit [Usitatibacter palustris]|uniref:Efflux pump periplasmic linker BepF n=1 Tax=Usitatibacter palustris TaxID=2732487 RepID=A0A6M4H9Q4_9PROT|nr:efflux RND transporter periplasmic adaptor subunit [Usitatibacter palustris]QJR15915.1 Efflux pump periplasmic linker BepF [Usitatibacter palustris]
MTSVIPSRRLAIAVGTLFAAGALVAGALAVRTSTAAPSPAAQAMPVAVAAVYTSDVTLWDEFSGRLEAVERVDVRSRVAGAVQSAHFTEGALVQKGDLLVTIDPAPYAAEVDRAQAQVAAAQARNTNAKSERERAERLWKEEAISRREVDERVNALREAEANVQAAEAALQSARLNLSYTQVRAPVSGRVGKVEVTQGNLVPSGPGAPVLTTLVSVNPIYASFDADEQVVARALRDAGARGLASIPVQMATAVDSAEIRTGHLQLVDNQVNAKSGTVRVRAVFDNKDGSLMPGQFAHVRLGRPTATPAVLVNDRAIGTDQSKKFVMVVGTDNKAAYREVTLGGNVNGLRIVSTGLEKGERIVVNGLQRVRPGALVDPQPSDMNKPEDRKVVAQKG